MSDKIRVNTLLDYYGALLTERQQELCRYYYRDDYSLQEIAELEGISRSAVHDTVRKSEAELEHYEETLKCIQAANARKLVYSRMEKDPSAAAYLNNLLETELIGGNYE
jgi:hypothetical protein